MPPRGDKRVSGNSSRRKGYKLEGDTIRELEGRGYWAQRSPRSGGIVDVYALRDAAKGEALFIQCKRDAAKLSPAEWNHLVGLARKHNAVPLLATRAPYRPLLFFRLLGAKVSGTRSAPQKEPFEP